MAASCEIAGARVAVRLVRVSAPLGAWTVVIRHVRLLLEPADIFGPLYRSHPPDLTSAEREP